METIQNLRLARMHTIGRVKRIKEENWDRQPAGFNNTIRWHVGHLFTIMEVFTHNAMPDYEPRYPQWVRWFDDGTSPDDWTEEVPSAEQLLALLREQLNWIIPFIEQRLSENSAQPVTIGKDVMDIPTNEGLAQFLAWHEGVHAGSIDAMNRFQV